jgi:hypothetical protein
MYYILVLNFVEVKTSITYAARGHFIKLASSVPFSTVQPLPL